VIICREHCEGRWGDQGKTFAVFLYDREAGKTVIFQLDAEDGVPSLPPDGVGSVDRPETLKGAKVVNKMIVPGPNPGQYAYLRQSVHRNLYRIPLH